MERKKCVNGKRMITYVFAVSIVLILTFCTINFVSALTHHGHDEGRSGTKIYSDTWFNPGVKSSSTYDSKMLNNRWTKSCWSKVTEGDDISYKSTKTLTSAQAQSSSTGLQEAYASQPNFPLKSQTYGYNWTYI